MSLEPSRGSTCPRHLSPIPWAFSARPSTLRVTGCPGASFSRSAAAPKFISGVASDLPLSSMKTLRAALALGAGAESPSASLPSRSRFFFAMALCGERSRTLAKAALASATLPTSARALAIRLCASTSLGNSARMARLTFTASAQRDFIAKATALLARSRLNPCLSTACAWDDMRCSRFGGDSSRHPASAQGNSRLESGLPRARR